MTNGEQQSRAQVLVVENEPATQQFLQYVLSQQYDVDIVEAFSGAEEKAQAHSYDVVLIDIGLSGEQTGVDVLNRLQEIPNTASAAMIACTAYAMPGDREHFLERGFDSYISKPFTRDRLIGVINEALQPE